MQLDLFIPTYNRSRLLDECLKSVYRARRPQDLNITVVVVDNNSTDNTKEVVQPYLEQNELPCRYIFVGRPGKSAALNEAVAQTSAELTGFIDDDEQIDPGWFEVVRREMTPDSPLDYIGGPYYPNWEIPLPNWLPSASQYGGAGLVIHFSTQRAAYTKDFDGLLYGGNAVIRRATLEKVIPFPEKLGKIGSKIRSGQDELTYHRLLNIGARGESVPDLIIYHWIPAARMTKRYYRKWAIGHGIGVGYQYRERSFSETGLLGIPRYKFGNVVRGLKSMLFAQSARDRFSAQLAILDCFAMLYGRHIYGRFNADAWMSFAARHRRWHLPETGRSGTPSH